MTTVAWNMGAFIVAIPVLLGLRVWIKKNRLRMAKGSARLKFCANDTSYVLPLLGCMSIWLVGYLPQYQHFAQGVETWHWAAVGLTVLYLFLFAEALRHRWPSRWRPKDYVFFSVLAFATVWLVLFMLRIQVLLGASGFRLGIVQGFLDIVFCVLLYAWSIRGRVENMGLERSQLSNPGRRFEPPSKEYPFLSWRILLWVMNVPYPERVLFYDGWWSFPEETRSNRFRLMAWPVLQLGPYRALRGVCTRVLWLYAGVGILAAAYAMTGRSPHGLPFIWVVAVAGKVAIPLEILFQELHLHDLIRSERSIAGSDKE